MLLQKSFRSELMLYGIEVFTEPPCPDSSLVSALSSRPGLLVLSDFPGGGVLGGAIPTGTPGGACDVNEVLDIRGEISCVKGAE